MSFSSQFYRRRPQFSMFLANSNSQPLKAGPSEASVRQGFRFLGGSTREKARIGRGHFLNDFEHITRRLIA